MSIHVLLHVNLLTTPETVRERFYELLEEHHWVKAHPTYTAWRCQYKDGATNLRSEVEREIKMLAATARVPRLYGVAQCGNSVAFDFEFRAAPRLYVART